MKDDFKGFYFHYQSYKKWCKAVLTLTIFFFLCQSIWTVTLVINYVLFVDDNIIENLATKLSANFAAADGVVYSSDTHCSSLRTSQFYFSIF